MDLKDKKLGDSWCLYHRDPQSKDWSIQSYEKILEIHTFGDLRSLIQLIPSDKITKGHISLMRHNIQPIYEDPENANGGAWTLKLRDEILPNHWKYYTIHTLINNVLTANAKKEKGDSRVNGIVLCPRRGFSVLQIWTNKSDLEYEDFNHMQGVTSSSILFRRHQN
jgi:hypothetical protein